MLKGQDTFPWKMTLTKRTTGVKLRKDGILERENSMAKDLKAKNKHLSWKTLSLVWMKHK